MATPFVPMPEYTGTPPNRGQERDQFNTNMEYAFNYFSDLPEDINATGDSIDALAAEAEAAEVSASTARDQAVTASDNAQSSSSYAGVWEDLTGALNTPASVFHDGAYWRLNTNLADVTASEPSVTNSDWQFISGTRWGEPVTANQTLYPNSLLNVIATGAVVELSLLGAIGVGDFYVIHNSVDSDSNARIVNNGYTISGSAGEISSSDDLTVAPGETAHLVVKTSSSMEIV